MWRTYTFLLQPSSPHRLPALRPPPGAPAARTQGRPPVEVGGAMASGLGPEAPEAADGLPGAGANGWPAEGEAELNQSTGEGQSG